MILFKPANAPDLINLEGYKRELIYQAKHGGKFQPPRPVPLLVGDTWSDQEKKAMSLNRAKAQALYEKYKAG